MTFTLGSVCYAIAAILFLLAALPPVAQYPLSAAGLFFLAVGHFL